MITARIALEVLRRSTQEQADAALVDTLSPEFDELAQVYAGGMHDAYQAIAHKIAALQSEGFTDPDPSHDLAECLEIAQRSLRLRQSCAQLRDMYREFLDSLTVQFGSAQAEQIEWLDRTARLIVLTSVALNVIVSELEPEHAAVTDQRLKELHEFLDTIRAALFTAHRGAGTLPLQ